MQQKIQMVDLHGQYMKIKAEIDAAIAEVIDSSAFINGPAVGRFASALAQYTGARHVIPCGNGTDALQIALMALGLKPGDEVIVPAFTYVASAEVIALLGLRPVMVDVDCDTFNTDIRFIEKAITPRTRAIIPVHLFGQAAEMAPILEIAGRHNLIVIEDAAQAIGSEYKGQRVGSFGHYGCFSFFPSKNLGCFGDGGMVTANTPERVEKLKIFRNHGMNPKYYHKYIGGNFRLDALQAAILSIKLKHLDSWTEARQRNAAEYEKLFAASSIADRVRLPVRADYATRHIYNQFSILVRDGRRDAVKAALQSANIGCDIYYPVPLHLQECFAPLGYRKGDLPVSEAAAAEILALPIYPESTTAMREYVVSTIEKALKS